MSSTIRLKGQETQIRLLRQGAPTQVAAAISNFEMTDELEVLEEEYLGRVAADYDDIYKGSTFTMEVHVEGDAPFDLRDQVIARAQRRGADAASTFDISFVGGIPGGTIKILTLVDVKFGPIGISDGGRGEYVTFKFEGSCNLVQTING